MSQPKHFEELAANAFDFLEKASDQLEKEPKYSVINFFTGIELRDLPGTELQAGPHRALRGAPRPSGEK